MRSLGEAEKRKGGRAAGESSRNPCESWVDLPDSYLDREDKIIADDNGPRRLQPLPGFAQRPAEHPPALVQQGADGEVLDVGCPHGPGAPQLAALGDLQRPGQDHDRSEQPVARLGLDEVRPTPQGCSRRPRLCSDPAELPQDQPVTAPARRRLAAPPIQGLAPQHPQADLNGRRWPASTQGPRPPAGPICLDGLEQRVVVKHVIQLGQYRIPCEAQGRHQVKQVHGRRALPPLEVSSLRAGMPLGMIA